MSQSDIRPIGRDQMELLQHQVKPRQSSVQDQATRVHLNDVEYRIDDILHPNS